MMFLCALGVFSLCFFVANSDSRQFAKTEARRATERYEMPQKIRELVPVDFAAASLRESRFKSQKNRTRYLPELNATVEKSASVGSSRRAKLKKRPSNRSKAAKHKGAGKTVRKRPKRPEWITARKSSESRLDGDRAGSERLPERTSVSPKGTTEAEYKNPAFALFSIAAGGFPDPRNRAASSLSDDVQKTINALPEELVKIVRDDTDCNDDMETKFPDVRGPPCALSHKWTASSGDAWFSPRNSVARNWTLFNN